MNSDVPEMMFALLNLVGMAVLFGLMLAFQKWGLHLGTRNLDSDDGKVGAAESAVFALLGLFIAFTFSGAGERFGARRHLVVQEANAIGTAWLRLDVLPEERQPPLRHLLRRYLDARLDRYRIGGDGKEAEAAVRRYVAIQGEIWSAAVRGAKESNHLPTFTVLLPALNDVFDIATTREETKRQHPPEAVFIVVVILAMVGSVFSGYGLAGRKARSRVHTLGFAGVMALTLYLIVDLEFPRMGLIRVDDADQVLVDLRRSMN